MNIGFCGATRSPRSRKKDHVITKYAEVADVPMISPTFFQGLSIYVNMDDPRKKAVVKKTLEITGSSIIEDPAVKADLIVTDKPITVPTPRSHGAKLAACIRPTRLIRTEQIPWAFMTQRMPPPVPEDRSKLLVIADSAGIQRPKFQFINNPIILHLGGGRTSGCPFDAGTSTSEKKAKESIPDGPPDNGYCQICKMTYKNAKEHQQSHSHVDRVSDASLYKDFDLLANVIWQENRFGLCL